MTERLGEPFAEPDYHLFAVDIESAAVVAIEAGQRVPQVWRAGDAP